MIDQVATSSNLAVYITCKNYNRLNTVIDQVATTKLSYMIAQNLCTALISSSALLTILMLGMQREMYIGICDTRPEGLLYSPHGQLLVPLHLGSLIITVVANMTFLCL